MAWRNSGLLRWVLVPALACVLVSWAEAQGVRYVNAAATGAGTGQTWADAYTSLQAALAEAAGGQVQEIWVAAGTYPPAEPAGDRSASFHLLSGVGVYGGFSGTETRRDQRDPRLHVTVLTGDLNGDDASGGPGAISDNSYHVVTGSGTDATAVLDGFVITGGSATAGGFPDDVGGGLINRAGSPTVVDCVFRGNTADLAGGAVYNEDSTVWLIHCVFESNCANSRGGAVYNTFMSASFIDRCTFAANNAERGGALHNSGSEPTVANSVFTGNSALAGGAVFANGGVMRMVNCTVVANTVPYVGGGLYAAADDPAVNNCIFWANGDASGTDESAQIARAGGSPQVNYTCIQGGWTGAGGTGIIVSDPIFVDPAGPDAIVGTADDDLRLQPESTSMNAGHNEAIPVGVTSDLSGQPRVAGGQVDLGAFEFASGMAADLDGDGDVDRDDLALFEACGTGPALGPPFPGSCLPADLDGDGDVDQTDYGVLQQMLQMP